MLTGQTLPLLTTVTAQYDYIMLYMLLFSGSVVTGGNPIH